MNALSNMSALDPNVFLQFGLAGIVLWWVMVRVEKRLDSHTSVLNDLVLAITLEVQTRDSLSPQARDRVDTILERATARKPHLSQ